jgi:hypothetical protein
MNYTKEMFYKDMNRRMIAPVHEYKEFPKFLSVAEYIKQYQPKTEERLSKKGTKIIKVYYSNVDVREYPEEHLESTCSFKR